MIGLWVFLAASSSAASLENYDYPIKNRYVATVVGTPSAFEAKLPKYIPFFQRSISIFPERKIPDVVWYGAKMLYSVALQNKTAPLIFLIAGTGVSHEGSKNHNMARAFYQAGFHVVSLSSPTYPNFVTSASSTAVVGHAQRDAEDLYRVMEMVWAELDEEIDASSFHLTGYSLGGFNAAYVSRLDETRGSFNFERVLLINPPVSLYNSISLLDRMIENIPGGVDNFDKFLDDLITAVSELYQKSNGAMGDDFLYQAYEALDLKDEQLAALIGTVFRLSSSSMAFASDVMVDFGYIKPSGLELTRYTNLSVYSEVANRLGFADYYHKFFYPYYRDDYPGMSRDEFISSMSLRSIAEYLRSAQKITVVHNADDVILEPGEINFFTEVFGKRATIYPYGGHCGNMNHRDNVAVMLNAFTARGGR